MPSSAGRTTIALTSEAHMVVDELCERFKFSERTDAAKFGIAYALRLGIQPASRKRRGRGSRPIGSTWGVGGFDSDGRLRELVAAAFPDASDDPYGTLEVLMNEGLIGVGKSLRDREPHTLAELVQLAD